jgi:hydroxymethylpyrimidine pyrophosphatase-like HAD family hydrolase
MNIKKHNFHNKGDVNLINLYNNNHPKKILLTLDLDGTLLKWNKNPEFTEKKKLLFSSDIIHKIEILAQHHHLKVLINTGRNLYEFSEGLNDFIRNVKLPIDAVALRNGVQLLRKPQNMSFNEFMNTLVSPEKASTLIDPKWKLKQSKAVQSLNQGLKKLKFKYIKHENGYNVWRMKHCSENKEYIQALVKPDTLSLRISYHQFKNKSNEFFARNSQVISDQLYRLMRQTNLPIKTVKLKHIPSFELYFPRLDVNKKTVADYYKQDQNIHSEIRAGDEFNDVDMLNDRGIYPILIKGNPDVEEKLKQRASLQERPLLKVNSENLPNAIEDHICRILRNNP